MPSCSIVFFGWLALSICRWDYLVWSSYCMIPFSPEIYVRLFGFSYQYPNGGHICGQRGVAFECAGDLVSSFKCRDSFCGRSVRLYKGNDRHRKAARKYVVLTLRFAFPFFFLATTGQRLKLQVYLCSIERSTALFCYFKPASLFWLSAFMAIKGRCTTIRRLDPPACSHTSPSPSVYSVYMVRHPRGSYVANPLPSLETGHTRNLINQVTLSSICKKIRLYSGS